MSGAVGKERKVEENVAVEGANEEVTVGTRGVGALKPPIPYLEKFFTCLQNPCDPVDNPDGHIALCVAENKLVTDLMMERCNTAASANAAFSDSEVYGYSSFLGLTKLREALAHFFVRKFLKPDEPSISKEDALELIPMDQVAVAAGCSAIINNTFFLLGEAGDACLIPAPFYAAFENDINIVAGCIPTPFHMADPAKGPSPADLDKAYNEATSKGKRVKFLLLTNPNNPLGVIYSPEVIRNAVAWARRHRMHIVVDEIYGLATHQRTGHGFQSVMRVLNNELGNDVHILWALSKDFGASGFRFGTVYSQNKTFLEAFANFNIFTGASHPMQALTADMLNDEAFIDKFLDESRGRLLASYQVCVKTMEELELPFIPAKAGLFIYVDLSSLLPNNTFEAERELCDVLMNQARMVLTPGESQREKYPGQFRICYAWISPEVLQIAMERLKKLVHKIRQMEWSDLKDSSLESIIG